MLNFNCPAWQIILPVVFLTSSVFAESNNTAIIQDCASMTESVLKNSSLGPVWDRALLLSLHEKRCAGTGFYDLVLASFFQQAGKFDDSDRTAKAGLVSQEHEARLLDVLAVNQISRNNLEKARQIANVITNKYPNDPLGYAVLGQIDTIEGKWPAALKDGTKYAELSPGALSSMLLATSLYQLKDYNETIAMVRKGLAQDPGRISNPNGLTEGIYALILVNRRSEAKDLLRRHIASNPNWKNRDAMVKAAKELGID